MAEVQLAIGTSLGLQANDAQRAFRDAKIDVERLLTRAELRGSFLLRPQERVTSRSNEKIRLKYVKGRAVCLVVKPGDNGSAWLYQLIPPHDTIPEVVLEKLRTSLYGKAPVRDMTEGEVIEATIEPEEIHKPEPCPQLPSAPVSQPRLTLLQRIGRLESAAARIEERKARIQELDREKLVLLEQVDALTEQINRIDADTLAIVEEDEKDTEAYDAQEAIRAFEKLMGV